MTIDFDEQEALYLSRKFPIGSDPETAETVLKLIAELRETRARLKQCARERRWLADYLSANDGPDRRRHAYEYLAMAAKYTKAEEK